MDEGGNNNFHYFFCGQICFLIGSHVSYSYDTDHCCSFFLTFAVLVPDFLMPYSPSCGGTGLSLNNLQGQTPSHVTGHPERHMNTSDR